MSLYQFVPSNKANCNAPFVTHSNAFTVEEIDLIKDMGNNLPMSKSILGDIDNGDFSEIRTSNNSWIELSAETVWLYEKLANIARDINRDFYDFDLYGFVEHMQYTVYDGDEQGHYTWHIDHYSQTPVPRKLTLVLQLSDPSEYEGGNLELLTSRDVDVVDKQLGLVCAFPSWTLHRVSPVTSGTRKTLVVWVGGPNFK